MIVMILERATPSMRGELTRWLIQPKTGVFVGHVSARVRDLLWQKVKAGESMAARTSGVMVYGDNTEQGFSCVSFGDTSKEVRDFEGLFLAKTKEKA
jgi:CRISPR-associated protein Cas2